VDRAAGLEHALLEDEPVDRDAPAGRRRGPTFEEIDRPATVPIRTDPKEREVRLERLPRRGKSERNEGRRHPAGEIDDLGPALGRTHPDDPGARRGREGPDPLENEFERGDRVPERLERRDDRGHLRRVDLPEEIEREVLWRPPKRNDLLGGFDLHGDERPHRRGAGQSGS
jgi:hypothetical protein